VTSARGRLKVYLGFAAGVGKTHRMLEEARALRARGVDAVIGFVETRGRARTTELLEGLELVPRRSIEYRGVRIEEMDVDAIAARHPRVAVVDEVVHTNAPGSRNNRRYLDVLELLERGVDVLCAFDVQHLESLNDLVQRATGLTVRETVPDTFLRQAGEVVALDLAVDDLIDRLDAGGMRGDLTAGALKALRELMLREAAHSIERAAEPPLPAHPAVRVMVCISSSSPRAAGLLRRGSRMAGRMSTDWSVVYVQTPGDVPDRQVHENIQLARELGAEVVRLTGRDPVAAILDFARSHRVGHLIVGRSHRPWWHRLCFGDVVGRIIAGAGDLDVHIATTDDTERDA
jgi:two-component system sensor histidine kinase KdpD